MGLTTALVCRWNTCLWDNDKAGGVGGNEAEEEGIHVHLKWSNSSHHAEVVHHQETVTGQPIQTSAGETTRSQKVSVDVEVRQAARESIKLILRLKSARVTKGNLW